MRRLGAVHARAPCCELKATSLRTVPSDHRSVQGPCRAITNLYADPWLAPASRAGRSAGRRFTGINILVTGSLGSTILPPRFAAVHRPPDSRSERLVKQQRSSFAAARPQSVFGARAPSPNVDDGDESSTPNCVLGAEFAHEFDWLDRHDDRNDKWT